MLDSRRVTAQQTLAAAPMLVGVPPDRVAELEQAGARRRYPSGAFLFLEGDESDSVHVILDGRVQVESTRDDGRTQLRAILGPGQVLGELGVLAGIARTGGALALDDVTTLRIPAEPFAAFIRNEPTAAEAMLRALALQVVHHEAMVEDLLFLDLRARVAKRLLALVSSSWTELPHNGVMSPANITQADLASLCGGSRENVNRALAELQKRGLIARDGHRYVLKDVAGLRRVAKV